MIGSDVSYDSIFYVLNVMGVVFNCFFIVDLMFVNSVICYFLVLLVGLRLLRRVFLVFFLESEDVS